MAEGQEGSEKVTRRPIKNALKRTYIEYVETTERTAYKACKHFKSYHPNVSAGQVHQWLKNKQKIMDKPGAMRGKGGGRKPRSEDMEEMLFEFIFSNEWPSSK